MAVSSGMKRTLRLVRHLCAFGWQSPALPAHPIAHGRTSHYLRDEIPPGTLHALGYTNSIPATSRQARTKTLANLLDCVMGTAT